MSMPVRSLPTFQNWDCQGCSKCCRTYAVGVSDEERERIEKQNWTNLGTTEFFERDRDGYKLKHNSDGACVFLNAENRCRIHEKFGSAAKPLACRVYPFVLVPVGNHWRAGLRYACPSSPENKGQPLAEHKGEVEEYAKLLELREPASLSVPPPKLHKKQELPWSDLIVLAEMFAGVLARQHVPLERRLRQIIALADLCRKLKFDKVQGERLKELLNILTPEVLDDTLDDPAKVPAPGWIGRMIFRQMKAIYMRKDRGPEAGVDGTTRRTRFSAAWRFARGTGRVPRLNVHVPETSFAEIESRSTPWSKATEQMLTRYYRVKLSSMQFCGPTNFHREFWDGLDSLLLTYPVIGWALRAFTAGDKPADDMAKIALQLVDDNFGYNRLLAGRRQVWATRRLAERGEIARLIARYGR